MFQKILNAVKTFVFGSETRTKKPHDIICVAAEVRDIITELRTISVKAESVDLPIVPVKIPLPVMAMAKKLKAEWQAGRHDARFTKTQMGWVKKAHRDNGYTVMVKTGKGIYTVRLDW
jgi:hypothetical protein